MANQSISYLEETPLLDFSSPTIERLVSARDWMSLPLFERVGAIYAYVRDEIRFGYNESDDLSASRVLADGYGQCNTKATLLMAFLRACAIPCRLHGATIHKRLQKGVVRGIFYWLAPRDILHTWVEVKITSDLEWVGLEGVILDKDYIHGIRHLVATKRGHFLGFGVGTETWENPAIEWEGHSTSIQSSGVNRNFGVFPTPDAFYRLHGANLRGFKGWLYRHFVRHLMNRRTRHIRGLPCDAEARSTCIGPQERMDVCLVNKGDEGAAVSDR